MPSPAATTLILGETESACKEALLGEVEGGTVRIMTWEQLERAAPEEALVESVLCQASEPLSSRRGLIAILRRAYPDVPFFSFSSREAAIEEHAARDLGLDAHIEVPLAARTLRMLVARECRLRSLAARHGQALARIREQDDRLDLLIETTKASNSLLEPRRVMQLVMDRTQEALGAEGWTLYLLSEDGANFEMTRGGGREPVVSGVPADRGLAAWVVAHRRPAVVENVGTDARWSDEADRLSGFVTRSVLIVPLISRGRLIGAVELLNKPEPGSFSDKDLEVVRTLMEPAAIAIENAILFKKLEDLSVTDDLTRLYNSRHLNQVLHQEIKRCRRYGYPVSLIFLDLDGFKNVNDRHGHLAGGRTLTEVGRIIRSTARETDIVSRYGGDEFAIVLPQTGAEGARAIAERIRAAIQDWPYQKTLGVELHLTASMGIAVFPDHGSTREELIGQADRAMYRIKETRKNGVELAFQAG